MPGVVSLLRELGAGQSTGWRPMTAHPPVPAGGAAQWDVGGAFGFGGLSTRIVGKTVYGEGVLTSLGRRIEPGFRGAILASGIPQPTARTAVTASLLTQDENQSAGVIPLGGVSLGRADGLYRDSICFDKYIGTTGQTTRLILSFSYLLP
ncbi:hypothetical protein [Litorihabitans aurantiacus]|uniref:Uncharacterized protein n=1 Tax=Litorihabitans aurantiacus TaxID=1930061 RepID=A0AA37XEA7_9MICO|nr:hypothetical protein [Litorihabitans aurantiacus]GMA31611.1 hypothetical protein GCM10025875_16030 [Litorihabitans aurantiacus]